MITHKLRCQALILGSQPPDVHGLRERPLHDPAAGQQHKPSFGFGMSDYFQLHPVRGAVGCRGIARDLLEDLRHRSDVFPFLLVRRRHLDRQQISASTAICTFEPLRRWAPS